QTTQHVLLQLVEFTMELCDLKLGLQVDFIVEVRLEPVFDGLAILAHHDDGCLKGRQHEQKQIQQNERIRIEGVLGCGQKYHVEHHPHPQDNAKRDDERP